MALAILELREVDGEAIRLRIDTGTNRYYQLKVGAATRSENGLEWIDEVRYTSPVQINPRGGDLFQSGQDITLDAAHLPQGPSYVQLFSFKSPDGRSSTFSEVLPVHGRFVLPPDPPRSQRGARMNAAFSFAPVRQMPCTSVADRYAHSASVDDILASVMRLAGPLVTALLGSAPSPGSVTAGSRSATNGQRTGSTAPNNVDPQLAQILGLLLHTLAGDGTSSIPALSQSLDSRPQGNRFQENGYAHPFIFGIDDALIGALAGPILQMLPQLMNAANQGKVQMRQADNRLISSLMSDVNRRLLLQQLAAVQPGGANPTDLARLLQLLQSADEGASGGDSPATGTAATPAAVAPTMPIAPASPATATGHSLSINEPMPPPANVARLAARAVVEFKTAPALPWNGTSQLLFQIGGPLRLSWQLTVGAPAPSAPLPKALLKIVVRREGAVDNLLEKTFRQKDLAANAAVIVEFTASELAQLPQQSVLDLVGELRWLSDPKGNEHKALGACQIVMVGKVFMKSQGGTVAQDVELTEMARFRPFWNKLWEAPIQDAASAGDRDHKKYLWELDLTAKYSVLLSSAHAANGVMDAKLLKTVSDPESLSDQTFGRMKAGIELSITELNKLMPLWPAHAMLDADQLQALSTAQFIQTNATDTISRVRLKGNAGQRGMVWMVPVFNLTQCGLARVTQVAASGQVVQVRDETVGFPLPVALRVLGLKTGTGADTTAGDNSGGEPSDATYHFDGYEIVSNERLPLTAPTATIPVSVRMTGALT